MAFSSVEKKLNESYIKSCMFHSNVHKICAFTIDVHLVVFRSILRNLSSNALLICGFCLCGILIVRLSFYRFFTFSFTNPFFSK